MTFKSLYREVTLINYSLLGWSCGLVLRMLSIWHNSFRGDRFSVGDRVSEAHVFDWWLRTVHVKDMWKIWHVNIVSFIVLRFIEILKMFFLIFLNVYMKINKLYQTTNLYDKIISHLLYFISTFTFTITIRKLRWNTIVDCYHMNNDLHWPSAWTKVSFICARRLRLRSSSV